MVDAGNHNRPSAWIFFFYNCNKIFEFFASDSKSGR